MAHPLWKPKVPMECRVCGTVVDVKPSLVSRFRSCSRRCNGILAQQSMPRISSLERAIDAVFRSRGLQAVAQHTFGPYIMDFAFPEHRVAIECDGVYWHSLPNRKERDASKDNYLTRHNWLVIRIAEGAIMQSPERCVDEVVSRLQQRHLLSPATHHVEAADAPGHPTEDVVPQQQGSLA